MKHAAAVLIAATGALFLALGLVAPPAFRSLLQEDGWAEWATFAAFALAAARFALAARRVEPGTPVEVWAERAVWLALALFCVFVAGEEVSWGQRVLAFRPPDVFLEDNFQQELNLHNFLKGKDVGGAKLDSRYLVAAAAFGYGVIAPLLKSLLKRGVLARAARPAPPEALVPLFVGVVAFELLYPVELTGEAAELVLGLCFAASPPPFGRPAALSVAAGLVAGALLAAIVPALFYGADEAHVEAARSELQALADELAAPGAVRPKLFAKGSVHKRVFTAERAGYFALAGPRRFFLDPWQNPYWALWTKKRRQLVLYSFGPNRRRDLSPKKKELGDVGDDIVVVVPVPR